jgi:hypothetical protein
VELTVKSAGATPLPLSVAACGDPAALSVAEIVAV